MGNLRESRKGAIEGIFGYLAKSDGASIVTPGESAKQADLFVVVNASTVELVDIEKYIEVTVQQKPLIIWNMELDTLRSDLGESHHSQFLPGAHINHNHTILPANPTRRQNGPALYLWAKGLMADNRRFLTRISASLL